MTKVYLAMVPRVNVCTEQFTRVSWPTQRSMSDRIASEALEAQDFTYVLCTNNHTYKSAAIATRYANERVYLMTRTDTLIATVRLKHKHGYAIVVDTESAPRADEESDLQKRIEYHERMIQWHAEEQKKLATLAVAQTPTGAKKRRGRFPKFGRLSECLDNSCVLAKSHKGPCKRELYTR